MDQILDLNHPKNRPVVIRQKKRIVSRLFRIRQTSNKLKKIPKKKVLQIVVARKMKVPLHIVQNTGISVEALHLQATKMLMMKNIIPKPLIV